jgi:hypothetical protein
LGYTADVAWDVEYTDEFEAWWVSLTGREQQSIDAAIIVLMRDGPTLGRPLVDTLKGSRHANMKELRPRRGNIRILFAFNPLRTAILLIGGDKTDDWSGWYERMIPVADDLYDVHLKELKQEGAL